MRGLAKRYIIRDSVWRRLRRQPAEVLHAVDSVDLTIYPGEIVGLVGESGSGKTTLGRCLLRLIEPSAGRYCIEGRILRICRTGEMQAVRRKMQIVFQNPYSSLNPRMTVRQTLERSADVSQALYPRHRRGAHRRTVADGRPAERCGATAIHAILVAASASASALRAPWRSSRSSSWPTSRYRRWTSRSRPKC